MSTKLRNTLFVLIGVAGLQLKRYYAGPYPEFIYSYLGNFSVSFAVYFLTCIYAEKIQTKKYLVAIAALAAVDLFEITNGFGIMKNIFDAFDFVANFAGIAFAFLTDRLFEFNKKSQGEFL